MKLLLFADDDDVWGVVYDIAEIDFGRLDVAEGFRPGRIRNSRSPSKSPALVAVVLTEKPLPTK